MSEHDKKVAGVEATANPAPSQGRRRLVKGAMLATPAVMTLMSGRLASAVSSGVCPTVTPAAGETGTPGTSSNYVDGNGTTLFWGPTPSPGSSQLLGSYNSNNEFTATSSISLTTSSCWASLPPI